MLRLRLILPCRSSIQISQTREEHIQSNYIRTAILCVLSSAGGLITSAAVWHDHRFCRLKSPIILSLAVRMPLVPEVLVVTGNWNWYCPQWLGMIIDFVMCATIKSTWRIFFFSQDTPVPLVKHVEGKRVGVSRRG